jgi:O-antigen ligase
VSLTRARPAGATSAGPTLASALVVLLCLSTVGEGGAKPTALLAWHVFLTLLILGMLWKPGGRREPFRVVAPGPLGGFAAFCGVALVAAALAPFGYAAWLVLLEIGAFGALAVLAARFGPELVRWAGLPLLAVAGVQTALAAGQRIAGGELRPAGTFLNPNHLAAWVVAVCLLVAGSSLLPGRRKGHRWPAAVAAACIATVALFVTGSRGALVGVLAGGGYLLIRGWTTWPRRWKLGVAGAAVLLVAAAGGAQLLRLGEADPFRYQRVRIWRASLQSALDSPWLGTGPGQFVAASRNHQFPEQDGPFRYDRSFATTHSDLIRVWTAFGIAGVAAFFWAAIASVRFIRGRRRSEALSPEATGAIAALVALAAQALVDNLSVRPALYLLAAALLGSLLSVPRQAGAVPRPGLGMRTGLGLLLLAVLALGDVAPYLAWKAVEDPPLPRGRLDTLEAERLTRALRLNPIHPDYWMRRAARLAADESTWTRKAYADARLAAETAVRLSPADPETHRELARVEAEACRRLFRDVASRERAADRFRQAEELARHSPFIPFELAVFLLDAGDPAGARRAAERALEIEPESVAPRLVLARALLELGGPRAAERAERLVAESREKFERWAAWQSAGPYARELLRPDPLLLDEIRQRLADAPRSGARPPWNDGMEEEP